MALILPWKVASRSRNAEMSGDQFYCNQASRGRLAAGKVSGPAARPALALRAATKDSNGFVVRVARHAARSLNGKGRD
jgi:hypothetical protein